MPFNSYLYIFVFLPICVLIYFILNSRKLYSLAKAQLVVSSLFFYSYNKFNQLLIILSSMVMNYLLGCILIKKNSGRFNKKTIMVLGVTLNIAFLGFFKYTDFAISNVCKLLEYDCGSINILLPLAISFFTFQQIAYLGDCYRKKVGSATFLDYCLFVTFFPQLIQGPIIFYKEIVPIFNDWKTRCLNWANISKGIYIFSIGLFKKVIIADALSIWVKTGFEAESLNVVEAWITSLSYTFQIYYDFSGYIDMAIGAALLFNIELPINFDSPYKALNIQEFWRRWHITLSRFLKNYLYIPLGGNRKGELRTYCNLFVTFLVGGIWHGAGWTFLLWGALHGCGMVIHRKWMNLGLKMSKPLGWFITFNFVNICWVFFRAKRFGDAGKIIRGMLGLNGIYYPNIEYPQLGSLRNYGIGLSVFMISALFFGSLCLKNSTEMTGEFTPSVLKAVYTALLFFLGTIFLSNPTEFIYYQF